jgi:hypothetical protein
VIVRVALRYWWLQKRDRSKRWKPTPAEWERAHRKTGRSTYRLATGVAPDSIARSICESSSMSSPHSSRSSSSSRAKRNRRSESAQTSPAIPSISASRKISPPASAPR